MTPAQGLVLKFKFKNGTPGTIFLNRFAKRHRDKIKVCKPLRQETLRVRACNGDVLTSQFARLEKIIQEHDIIAARIWSRDAGGKENVRVYVTRAGSRYAKIALFFSTRIE